MKNKIGLFIAVFIFFAIGNEIYTQITKKPKSAKSSRLICQKKAITFERILNPKLVKSLIKTLKSNDYKIVVWADKAKYAKSVMFDYVDIDIIKDDFIQKIKKYKTNNVKPQKTDDIFVDMMIYENDKKDPGKKTAKSKLYAGYIEVTFKVHNKVVYLIQIDFMSLKGEDIPQRISCIINSVMTLKE